MCVPRISIPYRDMELVKRCASVGRPSCIISILYRDMELVKRCASVGRPSCVQFSFKFTSECILRFIVGITVKTTGV